MNNFDQSWADNLKKPVKQEIVRKSLRKEGREIELPEEETRGYFNFHAIILLIAILLAFTYIWTSYYSSPRIFKDNNGEILFAIDPITKEDVPLSQLLEEHTEVKISSGG